MNPTVSSENGHQTDEPSRCSFGEGCKDRAEAVRPQSLKRDQRVGGVDGSGGSGRVVGVSCETCDGGEPQGTPLASVKPALTGQAGRAGAGVRDLRSSVDLRDSITRGERREGTRSNASQRSEGPAEDDGRRDDLWIRTSPKVRKLQRALYRKAKVEPQWRFYSLYGELCRQDLLADALDQVIANHGAPGVDGFRVEVLVDDERRAKWLAALSEELRTKAYKPSPVRRVYIWKDLAKTKRRPLGIPVVKDRVVQTAATILLQPIWEADFHDNSYAYRPRRNTHQAMDKIKEALLSGRTEVVDSDLSSYFDTIPHGALMRCVARRISDGAVLRLIKAWLRAPVVEEDREAGRRRIMPNLRGTPQGGVISPVLSNLYLNGLDHAVNNRCELNPVMVRYADDLVIMARPGQGTGLRERLQRWTQARGLKLNMEKTRLVNSWQETFCFLGFAVSWRRSQRGKKYPHVEPSAKSRKKLREKVRTVLNIHTRNQPTEEVVDTLNSVVRGWSRAFYYANSTEVFGREQRYICNTMRRWLSRKHKRQRGWTTYTDEELHDRYGLWQMPTAAAWKS